jgi:hypothetical protein
MIKILDKLNLLLREKLKEVPYTPETFTKEEFLKRIAEENKLLSFMDTGRKSLKSWLTTKTDNIQSYIIGIFSWHMASRQGFSASRHIFVATG